jgi:hypothetical protein
VPSRLATMYLRTNLTERQLAVLFGVSQKQVDRVLHDVVSPLGGLLGPAPTDQRELWIVDGTLIPTHDHARTVTIARAPVRVTSSRVAVDGYFRAPRVTKGDAHNGHH